MKLSLIIPTYERPEWTDRLLRFLASAGDSFHLLILDSSAPETVERNRSSARNLHLNISHQVYPQEIPFKDKLQDGLRRIDTDYCAFCADDDLVLPESLLASVRFLDRNCDYVGAQGLYFAYSGTGGHYFVDDLLYSHRGLDQPGALERLACLFEDYQSNFYGVFRTSAQRSAFDVATRQQSSLFFELMQSAHTAIQGKVARLPMIYAGRSRSPTAGNRHHWHPVEWLALDPRGYLEGYAKYREALLETLFREEPSHGGDHSARHNAEQVVDLIHLRYSLDAVRSTGLGAAIAARLAGAAETDVTTAAFAAAFGPPLPASVRAGGPAWRLAIGLARRAASVLDSTRRLASMFRSRTTAPAARRILQGHQARVEFNDHLPSKLSAIDSRLAEAGLVTIMNALDAYSEARSEAIA